MVLVSVCSRTMAHRSLLWRAIPHHDMRWLSWQAPNPVAWQRQCFFLRRGQAVDCYPEALHDSGVKSYGR